MSAPIVNVDWEHVGSYFMDASNSALNTTGSNIIRPQRRLYFLSGQSRLSLRIDNLLDEEYAKRADKWFGNECRYFPGEGQQVHGAHNARFLRGR